MPAQITLWRASGDNQGYTPNDDDDDRGQKLLQATNDAVAGDTVVVGPGNYKKQGAITRDGVRIHLHPGARIYSTSDGPVVLVTSGTHWISGHGVIEHMLPLSISEVQTVSVTGGSLVCEADQIICTDESAVNVAGASATLHLNARIILAREGSGITLADGTCFIRAEHVIADSKLSQGSGISVSSGNSSSVRIVNVQRVDSTKGTAILLQGAGRCNIWSQSVHCSNNSAVRMTNALHYVSLGRASNAGTQPAIKLESGHVVADEIEHLGTAGRGVDISAGGRLSAHRVLAANPSTSNGIKVLSSSTDSEPVVDVGEIVVGSDLNAKSIFADSAQTIYLIRNFRSLRGLSSNIAVLTPNHP